MDMSRRSFIVSSTAAAAAGAAFAQAEAQPAPGQPMPAPMPRGFNPSDPALKYDLVISGGDVLDASMRSRSKRDVGIKNGQIAAVAASIPADRATQRIDAAGKLVTPGLIDLHTHLPPPRPRAAG
jgi:dihydroorotase